MLFSIYENRILEGEMLITLDSFLEFLCHREIKWTQADRFYDRAKRPQLVHLLFQSTGTSSVNFQLSTRLIKIY